MVPEASGGVGWSPRRAAQRAGPGPEAPFVFPGPTKVQGRSTCFTSFTVVH